MIGGQAGLVTFVQARIGSSRLPGKALRPLCGRTMLSHVLERAAAIGPPVWLVTSEADRDDPLASLAHQAGFSVYRGSERDVLLRMAEAATVARAEAVVRVTGDCPLLAPDVSREVVCLYRQFADGGYASNDTAASGWPDGVDTEVFSVRLLFEAERATRDPVAYQDGPPTQRLMDREHVTPWIRRHALHHRLLAPADWRHVKLSVDTLDELERVRGVMARLDGRGHDWAATRSAYLDWQEEERRCGRM